MNIEELKSDKDNRQSQLNEVLKSINIEDTDKNASLKKFNSSEELIDFLYDATLLIKLDDTGKVNKKLRELCKSRIPSLTSVDVMILLMKMSKSYYPLGEYHSLYRLVEQNCNNQLKVKALQSEYVHVKGKK